MPPASKVLVRNVATGQLGEVPADKAELFLNDPDYRLAESGELEEARRDAANRTLAGKAETVLYGAAENIADSAQTAFRMLDSRPMRAIGGVLAPLAPLAVDAAKAGANSVGMDLTDPGRSLMGQTIGTVMGREYEGQYAARARELASANPTSFTVGEALGGVTTGLLTGGVGGVAAELGAARLAEAGLRPFLARAAASGLSMAAEGGFYGAAGAETQARLAGKTTGASAEELLQGIGLGALIGGGIGAGGSATMSAFRKLVARADELAPVAAAEAQAAKASDNAVRAFEGVGDDRVARLQSTLTGADLETLQEFGAQNFSAKAVEGRNLWRNREKLISEAVPEVTQALNKMDEAIEAVTSNVKQFELKKEGVARMLDGIDQDAAKVSGLANLRTATATLETIAAEIPTNKLTASVKRRVDNALAYANGHLGKLGDNATAAEVYVASDFIKRELQAAEKSLQFTATHTGDGTTREAAMQALNRIEREVQEPFRLTLENQKLWGRAGEAQAAINARWKPFIETSGRYNKEMTAADGGAVWADGRQKYYADSAKVQSWIEGIGTSRGQTAQEIVRSRIDSARELLDAIDRYHPLDERQQAKLSEARKAYATVQSQLDKLDVTVGIANRIDDVAKAERDTAYLTSPVGGRVVGAITGAIGAGPMGAAIGGLGMLNRPAAAMAAAEQIRGLADRVGFKVVSGAGKWVREGLDGAVAKAGKVAARVAPQVERGAAEARRVAAPTAVAIFQGKAKTLDDAYEQRSEQILRVQNDPDALIEQVARATGGLANVDPDLAGALIERTQAAISFLASRLPAGTLDPTPLNPGRKAIVPKLEQMRYARIWAAVERPMTVLQDLRRGVATPDQIEALRVVHPATLKAIQNEVRDVLIDSARRGKKVPLAMRQQLDLLLDLGGAGEPALGPEISDRITALAAKQKQNQPKPKGASRPPNLTASTRLPQDGWPSNT